MSNRRFWATKLGIKIIGSALIALGCAALFYSIFFVFMKHKIGTQISNVEFINQTNEKEVNLFQKFVTENNISTEDTDKIKNWVENKRAIMLIIYDGDNVIFNSTVHDFRPPKEDKDWDKPYKTFYDVKFKDKDVKMEIFCFIEYRYFIFMNYINLTISFIIFVVVLLMLIKNRTAYINQLEDEIKILEGGDLEYPITVKGNDELGYLAKSIDDMRKSFIERLIEEENARTSNHKLVTAMSHDLRTPLTVLIGLLEILDGKKFTDEKQREEYIHKSREKAYQIKQLSDKLFEYFLAFNIEGDKLNFSEYGSEVINELIEDYIFTLDEKGYKISFEPIKTGLVFNMDIDYIHRVVDNVFSNLLKYADKEKEIWISSKYESGFITISIENEIDQQKVGTAESTNIGIETCKNIMKEHNGEFRIESDKNRFTAIIKFKI